MTDYQMLTNLLEDLKKAGLIYNDADFCRKTGLSTSFVSEMKNGKKPLTAVTRKKIEESFPDFFAEGEGKTTPDVSQLLAIMDQDRELIREMARRKDVEIDRLLAIVEAMTGAASKKEKTA